MTEEGRLRVLEAQHPLLSGWNSTFQGFIAGASLLANAKARHLLTIHCLNRKHVPWLKMKSLWTTRPDIKLLLLGCPLGLINFHVTQTYHVGSFSLSNRSRLYYKVQHIDYFFYDIMHIIFLLLHVLHNYTTISMYLCRAKALKLL